MRLWSVHPKYLDQRGLCGLWTESLLAQKVLMGETKGYKNHPQLERFKLCEYNLQTIKTYLYYVWSEANNVRGYNFDGRKIKLKTTPKYNRIVLCKNKIPVTTGQLEYEFKHLQKKLWKRDIKQHQKNCGLRWDDFEGFVDKGIEPNPLFKVVEGDIEKWEKVKEESND